MFDHKENAKEWIYTLAKAGISLIPYIGGPAIEIFSQLVESPLSRRRDAWFEKIYNRLLELEMKVSDFSIVNH